MKAARSSTYCSELGADHPAGQASITHIEHVREIVRHRAVAAGLTDVEDFASSWHILMKGAIILAAVGDLDAALRARKMASVLIDGAPAGGAGGHRRGGKLARPGSHAASAAVVPVLR